MISPIQCCVTQCDMPLDKDYWDLQWKEDQTGWDIGFASPAIIEYFKTISSKELKILIPGCGSAYEAEWLVQNGFKSITLIDISTTAVEILKTKFKDNLEITVLCQDFFELEGTFDLIIEQTFFCALPPQLRPKYLWKMHKLLSPKGRIAGLMFSKLFDKPGPPFGGTKEEYHLLFSTAFDILQLENTSLSIAPRMDSELWVECKKDSEVDTFLYKIEGITCIGCSTDISKKLTENLPIKSAHISSDFSLMTIVSSRKIRLDKIQEQVAYDAKYKILEV